ncbi:MAG: PQQ-dependent sugar dehydrogenase, partial [Solirubrobacterales bacterium]|nr:PQQ-dependent sugar dehydrogenase [Solirubrobacterales bacterium]
DNPFADREGALEEVVLYGLRNPWRYSFDRQTGDLWIGDVGQSSQEEVDGVTAGTAGESFGWSAFEGTERFNDDQSDPDAVPPVLTYSHETGGCSVTGGYVVRDPELPSLYGRYVYGDFCVGELRSFTAVPGREATDDRGLGLEVPALSSFGEDNSGQIYATSAEGEVFRLVAE